MSWKFPLDAILFWCFFFLEISLECLVALFLAFKDFGIRFIESNLLKYVLFPLRVWLVGRKTLYQYFDFFRCGLLVHFIFRLHKILIHVHDYEVMGFPFFNFASHIFPFYAHYNSSINPTTNNPCLLLHVFMILYLST